MICLPNHQYYPHLCRKNKQHEKYISSVAADLQFTGDRGGVAAPVA